MGDPAASSCDTREAISSELSRRLSLPLDAMAARRRFSRSMLTAVLGVGPLGGAKRLGRKLWKAFVEVVAERTMAITRVCAIVNFTMVDEMNEKRRKGLLDLQAI